MQSPSQGKTAVSAQKRPRSAGPKPSAHGGSVGLFHSRPPSRGCSSVSPWRAKKRGQYSTECVGGGGGGNARPASRGGGGGGMGEGAATASQGYKRHLLVQASGQHHSNESWIPEDVRRRMISRDLSVAKRNWEVREACRTEQTKRRKSALAGLERSKSKEKYGIERRRPCGLCMFPFLPVNLTMAVPLKAVLDIRDSWGDKFDPEGRDGVRVNPNLRRAPACYNETRVCVFCSQLFDRQQETYRPSWEAKEAERELARKVEEERLEKVLSDPLAQIQREREEEVSELTRALNLEENGSDGDGGGGGQQQGSMREQGEEDIQQASQAHLSLGSRRNSDAASTALGLPGSPKPPRTPKKRPRQQGFRSPGGRSPKAAA